MLSSYRKIIEVSSTIVIISKPIIKAIVSFQRLSKNLFFFAKYHNAYLIVAYILSELICYLNLLRVFFIVVVVFKNFFQFLITAWM